MADSTEPELIDRFLSNATEQSFAALFPVLYPQVLRYFSFRGFAKEIAEEMAQDVLVTVFRKSSTVRDRGLFRPWLFKVAQNTMRQYLRRTHNNPHLRSLEEASAMETEAAVPLSENDGFLEMISVLNPEERQVMILRYIDDLSYEEIASVLNLAMGTVKWKIFDSKARICASLRQNNRSMHETLSKP